MQDLIDNLSMYPKLQQRVQLDWGTVSLKNFLEEILSDTRGNTRQGFPAKIAETLLKLSIINTELLEEQGLEFPDFEASQFANTGWHIPKNF